MKILHNRVLVEIIKQETIKSGIILPASEQKKNIGKVILIGEKVQSVSVGDTVKYHANEGISFNYHGKDCLFQNEKHQIIAVL